MSLFHRDLPLEKGNALHLNKLESPSPKNTLCWDWLKLAHWFWSRRFFKFVNVFSLFRNYLPLEINMALHLRMLKYHSPKDALCQVWLKLAQWFGKEDENVKSLRQWTNFDQKSQPSKEAHIKGTWVTYKWVKLLVVGMIGYKIKGERGI